MVAVSFIIPCRDKAAHVGRCLESALAQTVDDFELVISDQGSEDGSAEVIAGVLDAYQGKKAVRFLRCPDVERRGMAGLNAHLNWLHDQINGELVINCSADDVVHPERVERTRWAYEQYRPSYVCTRMTHEDNGAYSGETMFPDRMSRWVAPAESLQHLIVSSGSSAWARDLYGKHGPLVDIESQDIVLPLMALLERGVYYLDEPLHTYCWHPSLDNTGLMGQQRAAKTPDEVLQTNELAAFHLTYNWFAVMRRWQALGWQQKLSPEAQKILHDQSMIAANAWALARGELSMKRTPPREFRA